MAVYAALEAKEDVKYLLSMKSKNDESYMFHVPNTHVTDLLSEALDIPIMSVETDGVKEEELEDLKAAFLDLKDLGVEAITQVHFIQSIRSPGLKNWVMRSD